MSDNETTLPAIPKPERFATYNGDRANMLNGIYGPNELNELMCATEITYDPETDTSKVGFVFATLPMLKAALASTDIEIAPEAFARLERLVGMS